MLAPIDIDTDIAKLGRAIFERMGQARPSTFDRHYLAGIMMMWSMKDPAFKVNLFRLIDVLPQLKSSQAIAEHLGEYLGDVAHRLPGLGLFRPITRQLLSPPPFSLRGVVASHFIKRSVQQMANLFIAGENPSEAIRPLRELRASGLAFTVDLLGEFSVSEPEALTYVDRYIEALEILGSSARIWPEASPLVPGHVGERSPVCVSVKLTALYSQCQVLNFDRSVGTLSERLGRIVRKAKEVSAQVYIDAEDSGNNPIIYQVFKNVFGSHEFRDLPLPGIVVQAYSRGAIETIEDLLRFAGGRGSPIAIRLVKGAYWDQETILSEQNGWPSPLFRHKQSSDANFERLSRILIDNAEVVMPAFGSHNIRSLSHACAYAERQGLSRQRFELQMLYGMASPIANAFSEAGHLVRMYVPLGDMLVGMGYLVRRLLENTSNESFLRHTFFEADQMDALLAEPRFHAEDLETPGSLARVFQKAV